MSLFESLAFPFFVEDPASLGELMVLEASSYCTLAIDTVLLQSQSAEGGPGIFISSCMKNIVTTTIKQGIGAQSRKQKPYWLFLTERI